MVVKPYIAVQRHPLLRFQNINLFNGRSRVDEIGKSRASKSTKVLNK